MPQLRSAMSRILSGGIGHAICRFLQSGQQNMVDDLILVAIDTRHCGIDINVQKNPGLAEAGESVC